MNGQISLDEVVLEVFFDFVDLGGDDVAVGVLAAVQVVVVLVVLLRRPELRQRQHLRGYLDLFLLLQLLYQPVSDALLALVQVEDRREILAADVVALSVHLRRVVCYEEHL